MLEGGAGWIFYGWTYAECLERQEAARWAEETEGGVSGEQWVGVWETEGVPPGDGQTRKVTQRVCGTGWSKPVGGYTYCILQRIFKLAPIYLVCVHVWRFKGQLLRVGLLLLPRAFWACNSGH